MRGRGHGDTPEQRGHLLTFVPGQEEQGPNAAPALLPPMGLGKSAGCSGGVGGGGSVGRVTPGLCSFSCHLPFASFSAQLGSDLGLVPFCCSGPLLSAGTSLRGCGFICLRSGSKGRERGRLTGRAGGENWTNCSQSG